MALFCCIRSSPLRGRIDNHGQTLQIKNSKKKIMQCRDPEKRVHKRQSFLSSEPFIFIDDFHGDSDSPLTVSLGPWSRVPLSLIFSTFFLSQLPQHTFQSDFTLISCVSNMETLLF